MFAQKTDFAQMIAMLNDEYRIAAVKYVEYLVQAQKIKAKGTLHQIQAVFADDKGWNSEQEMIADMANFRRERLARCEY